jgi:hypothetical protein
VPELTLWRAVSKRHVSTHALTSISKDGETGQVLVRRRMPQLDKGLRQAELMGDAADGAGVVALLDGVHEAVDKSARIRSAVATAVRRRESRT